MKHLVGILIILLGTAGTAWSQDRSGVPNSTVHHRQATLPLQDFHAAMNLCAHAVQQAIKIDHIKPDDSETYLRLCAEGRFHEVHGLLAEPEAVWMYIHPVSGAPVVLPHWAVNVLGIPEGATLVGPGAPSSTEQ